MKRHLNSLLEAYLKNKPCGAVHKVDVSNVRSVESMMPRGKCTHTTHQ